ncbi:hypothetical protein B0A50_08746 [Salinomyces thailandicus]|uniref:KANL3/Tex30 alpha/beta hydrolase-like domain-containing protein n=1 Tax=Salinomyces thailandicus TaxID=706561 RepID=A0A4U0TIW8_9PEZI|nr:hypothetical protein B0A50_08746 [Salinomyces thailandica]
MAPKRKARSTRNSKLAAAEEDTDPTSTNKTKGDQEVKGNSPTQPEESNNPETTTTVKNYTLPFQKDKPLKCERRGKATTPSLIFTHGAGGGLATPATQDFADGFADKASIVAFQATTNLPSRVQAFHAVMENENFRTALGGRSMGGRAATIAATQEKEQRQTDALVIVSFPLIGGKNKDSREQILLDLPREVDVLFLSGSKDALCPLSELAGVRERMKARSWLLTVTGANHGMEWKWKGSVRELRRLTGSMAAEWLESRDGGKRSCEIFWDEEAGKIGCAGWQDAS